MRSIRPWLLIGAGIVLTLLYFGAQQLVSNKVRYTTVTAFSRGGTGTSFFFDLMKAEPGSASLSQSVNLTAEELSGFTSVALFSPNTALSPLETTVIENFVREGRTLLVSAHNAEAFATVGPLLKQLHFGLSIKDNPAYVHSEPQTTRVSADSRWFKRQETYAVYSPIIFDDADCVRSDLECFVRVQPFGKGDIIVMLGLPLVNNLLITQKDNRQFAFRVGHALTPMLIDEYHHFFSDKTFWDMMKEPAFGLTMVGVFAIVLLFYIFAYTKFHETSLAPPPTINPGSYHDLGKSLVEQLLNDSRTFPTVLKNHEGFLRQAGRRDRHLLEQELADRAIDYSQAMTKEHLLKNAKVLITVHYEWLRKKGKVSS
jgi:hypothetical protein